MKLLSLFFALLLLFSIVFSEPAQTISIINHSNEVTHKQGPSSPKPYKNLSEIQKAGGVDCFPLDLSNFPVTDERIFTGDFQMCYSAMKQEQLKLICNVTTAFYIADQTAGSSGQRLWINFWELSEQDGQTSLWNSQRTVTQDAPQSFESSSLYTRNYLSKTSNMVTFSASMVNATEMRIVTTFQSCRPPLPPPAKCPVIISNLEQQGYTETTAVDRAYEACWSSDTKQPLLCHVNVTWTANNCKNDTAYEDFCVNYYDNARQQCSFCKTLLTNYHWSQQVYVTNSTSSIGSFTRFTGGINNCSSVEWNLKVFDCFVPQAECPKTVSLVPDTYTDKNKVTREFRACWKAEEKSRELYCDVTIDFQRDGTTAEQEAINLEFLEGTRYFPTEETITVDYRRIWQKRVFSGTWSSDYFVSVHSKAARSESIGYTVTIRGCSSTK